jgi:sugar phosphate isomerase/epimerase
MKIGVSSLASEGKNIVDFLKFVEDLNIKYLELLHEYPNDNIAIDLLDSYSLKYTVHSPISDLNLASSNNSIKKASINEIKRSIDFANNIDAKILVVHPGRISFTQRFFQEKGKRISEESMKICGDYGKNSGVEVCIENMPNMEGVLYQNVKELNEFLKENDLSMTLDIGHENTVNKKTDRYFESVKHIHLSDNNGDFDYHYALGEGSIDFKAVFDIYNQNNYNGIYMLEVNDKDSVKKSLDYLKKF